ncbi:MAG: DUF1799 domain-containing protein [Pseudorhodoferax sp.]
MRRHHGSLPPGRGRGPAGKLKAAAAALYESDPSKEELAAFGFKPGDYQGDVVQVWPENHAAVMLFRQLMTQWRVGMAGPTGLDHNVLISRLDRMGLTAGEWDDLDEGVRVMEHQALETMAEEREKREAQSRKGKGG